MCGAADGRERFPGSARSAEILDDAASVAPSSDLFGLTAGTVYVCGHCGHGAVVSPPAAEIFEGAYTAAADVVSLDEEPGQVATAKRDLQWVEHWVQPGRLLDVGCWTGSLLVAAADRGWEAEGLEPSEWACARAAVRGCAVRQATLDEVDLPTGRYRLVVAADVIEHLVDPAAALRSLRQALEADGVLYLTVPDAGSRMARLLGRRWWSVLPMHLHYFTRTSMTSLLEQSGFSVEAVRTHAKAFSLGYYMDRLVAFAPVGSKLLGATQRQKWRRRLVAPDLGDRMAVVARKVDA